MHAADHPNPSAPVECRIWLRYAKRGKLRFASHRDLARAFERALRSSGMPTAHSQGFSPHPKLSWAGAVPTGAASEAEYVEIGLVREVDPNIVGRELDAAMPEGLTVMDAVVAGHGALADRIDAALWRIEVPGVTVAKLANAVDVLRQVPKVEVERLTKRGRRAVDVQPALVSLQVTPADVPLVDAGDLVSGAEVPDTTRGYGILTAVVRQMTPTVRPDDVLSALRVVAALELPVPELAVRMAQGRLDNTGRLADPLAPQGASGSAATVGEQERSQFGVE